MLTTTATLPELHVFTMHNNLLCPQRWHVREAVRRRKDEPWRCNCLQLGSVRAVLPARPEHDDDDQLGPEEDGPGAAAEAQALHDIVRELIVDRDIEFEHDHPDEYDLDYDGEHGYVP